MERLAAGALAAFTLLAGCLGEKIHRCANGAICPQDQACTEVTPIVDGATLCGLPRLVDACTGKNEFERCNYTDGVAEPDGTCRSNVCIECLSVDVTGCVERGWNSMSSAFAGDLADIAVIAPASAVAVGANRALLQYDGARWTESTIDVATIDAGVTVSSIWALDATSWFATTGGGEVLQYRDGVWSEVASVGGQLVAVHGANASAIIAVGFAGNTLRFDGTTWLPLQVTPPVPLFGVWFAAPDVAFAVGAQGAVFRYEGGNWSNERAPNAAEPPLRAVYGRSPTDLYAVGAQFNNKPNVLHYDGVTWERLPIYEDFGIVGEHLWGIYVADNGEVFVSGEAGKLLRYDGSAWKADSPMIGNPILYSVSGSSEQNVIAVGTTGRIVRYTGLPAN